MGPMGPWAHILYMPLYVPIYAYICLYIYALEGSFFEDVLPPEGGWSQPLMLKSPKRDMFLLRYGPGPIWARARLGPGMFLEIPTTYTGKDVHF